jgi:hypothetical protein
VPNRFEFKGGVIIITNLDFDALIAAKHRHAKHFEALMSRAHYIDLGIKSPTHCMIRVKTVVKNDRMLEKRGLNVAEEDQVIEYMTDNLERLREVSLRMAVKISDQLKVYRGQPERWKPIVDLTCLRR